MTGVKFFISDIICIQKLVTFSFPFVYCFALQNVHGQASRRLVYGILKAQIKSYLTLQQESLLYAYTLSSNCGSVKMSTQAQIIMGYSDEVIFCAWSALGALTQKSGCSKFQFIKTLVPNETSTHDIEVTRSRHNWAESTSYASHSHHHLCKNCPLYDENLAKIFSPTQVGRR